MCHMARLVCLTHREYNGKAAPQLTCKNCCSIYIAEIRKRQSTASFDTKSWVESKKQKNVNSIRPSRGLDINPEWI